MSEENGGPSPKDELAPRRRRRRKRREPVRPDNRHTPAHAAQIALLTTSAEARLERRATELRLQGRMYREIADELGVSYESTVAAITRVLRREAAIDQAAEPEMVEQIRQLELGRLDRLWSIWFPRALGDEEAGREPNMAAANYCLKVMKRRAEYLGLDREEKAPMVSLHLDAETLTKIARDATDATNLAAIERVAALYAHGEVVDSEALEEEEHQQDQEQEEEEGMQADPQDHRQGDDEGGEDGSSGD